MVGQTQEISEDEAALYDRQIRLWGLEAQKRLRASRLLVAGLCGLGAEICKNTVLAGIKSLTLLDHLNVEQSDLYSQYFLRKNDIGKNRAACSLNGIQQLNPMVTVTADTDNISDKPDSFFENFDVVCVVSGNVNTLLRVNNICHAKNIKFLGGDVLGYYGYMFQDLGSHDYVEEKIDFKSENTVAASGISTSNMKKTKSGWKEVVTIKNTSNFATLENVLGIDWDTEEYESKKRKLSTSFFIMQIFQSFYEKFGRKPDKEHAEEDAVSFQILRDEISKKFSYNIDKIEDFSKKCFAELGPVCAIVGGVIGQEIIKGVSHKDRPFNNFFFYNGVTGEAAVELIA